MSDSTADTMTVTGLPRTERKAKKAAYPRMNARATTFPGTFFMDDRTAKTLET